MEISVVLKILADENRLRILNIIKNGEMCVGEISTILEISRSNASKHLERLKMASFIESRKEAQWIYYSIKEDLTQRHPFIHSILFNEALKETLYIEDLAKLRVYKESGLNCQNLRDSGFDFVQIEEAASKGGSQK